MAKKRPIAESSKDLPSGKPIVIALRGSEEYRRAIAEVADLDGKSVAALTDHALRFYARAIGYQGKIPRR